MKRWLMMTLALGLAVAAGYALLTALPLVSERSAAPSVGSRRSGAAEPNDHIDRASREALRDLLREAGEDESR